MMAPLMPDEQHDVGERLGMDMNFEIVVLRYPLTSQLLRGEQI